MATTSKKVLTYLLVEDDEDHANLIRECIQHGDMAQNVRHVSSGVNCLHYLNGEAPFNDRSQYPYPDIVLLDIRMPGTLDGLQTLQIIRADQRHRSLAVMIFTTSDRQQDINQAYELGVNGYIVKSGDISQMIEQLLWVRWSFESLISLPAHHQPTPNGNVQANGKTLPSVTALAFLVSNEDTALNMLVTSYQENRKGFIELLNRLEKLDTSRFECLVHQFSLQHCDLFAGQNEVDWDFIRHVVREKLPKYLSAEEMAEVADRISAAIEANAMKDEDLPFLQAWQEFHQDCTGQITSSG